MRISLIAAIGRNREIGYRNRLLWNIPEDMKWFQEQTKGKVVVMGRNTYESIGKPLSNRTNVVLSRSEDFNPGENVIVLDSVEKVLLKYRKEKEIMVIGGGVVYEKFLPYANRLYITHIDREFKADTFFPKLDANRWTSVYNREGKEITEFNYRFVVYIQSKVGKEEDKYNKDILKAIKEHKKEYLVGLTRAERELKEILIEGVYAIGLSDNIDEIRYWYIELFPEMYGKTEVQEMSKDDMMSRIFDWVKLGWTDKHMYFGDYLFKFYDSLADDWYCVKREREQKLIGG